MKTFWEISTSWVVLAVLALNLVIICWPWANHWVSYGWLSVVVAVLLSELGNKLFSPKKQTWSNNTRDESLKDKPVRFWMMISVWMIFAIALSIHFMAYLVK